MLVVSDEKPLEEGANICYGSNIAEADLADLQFITGNPANWNNTWVTYDGDAVGYADGKFFAETPDAEKHIHCLCGAEVNKGETCALCGSVATEWTKTATMPTVAGNYYLTENGTPVTGWQELEDGCFIFDEQGVLWMDMAQKTSYEPGLVHIDGWLYYVQEDGHFLKDGKVGQLTFGSNYRYTTGDVDLDGYVAELLDGFIEANPKKDRFWL